MTTTMDAGRAPVPRSTTNLASWLTDDVVNLLRCPRCGGELAPDGAMLTCTQPRCGHRFPIVDGIPILIDESSSVFSINDILKGPLATTESRSVGMRLGRRLVPATSANLVAEDNFDRFAELLLLQSDRPRVLTIGGAITGKGLDRLLHRDAFTFVETDVSLGPRTAIVCDAHALPFADGSFDGVIAQAVLEHVVEPYRCVAELHRVLKDGGAIYAETPFLQHVHAGAYDFTRFTLLGHRRLFRHFEEEASGAVAGPGTVLAWAYQYFLLSLVERPTARAIIKALARMTSFWLKHVDGMLLRKPGALDAASAYYFLGRKSTRILSDRELIATYPRPHMSGPGRTRQVE